MNTNADLQKNAQDAQAIKKAAVDSAMALAEELGWAHIGFTDIAERAGVSLADLRLYFDHKTDILVALGRQIDAQVLENIEQGFGEESIRDVLFDVMMDRFEVMGPYRGGIIAVLRAMKTDPKQALISLPHLCSSITWMLEAAQVNTSGIKGALRVSAMSGLYLKVLKSWVDDDSPDLSQTMAALDKALNRAEQLANTFGI